MNHLLIPPPNKFIVYSKIPDSIFHRNEINIYFYKTTSVNQYNRLTLKYSKYNLELDLNVNTYDARRRFLNNLQVNHIHFKSKSYSKIRIKNTDYTNFKQCLYGMFTLA